MAITFQLRRGTSSGWTTANTVLGAGEPGFESDTGRLKIGDGLTAWNGLDYLVADATADNVVLVSPTTVISLDTAGAGKQFTTGLSISSNSTLTVGTGPVALGCLSGVFLGDGSHDLAYGVFKNTNGYVYDHTQGQQNCYFFVADGFGNYLLSGYAGGVIAAITPVTLSSAAVDEADATKITLTWSHAISSTISAAAAFAVSSGHSLTAHTYVDSTHTYLTTSTPFLGTESAKTLAYTQPASNKMQDAAGTFLVSTFSGSAITNTVVNPTLVSAVVANATPTKIDLTWSEAMPNVTLSATANFAVNSGHALTGTHTWIDATHSQLTTSVAFVAAETKTLAYTPSGTADMHDVNSNKVAAFSGFAITDNVGGAGSITYVATLSPTPVDFTGGGYDDWVADGGTPTFARKGTPGFPVGTITVTTVNLTFPGWGHVGTGNTATAGDSTSGNAGTSGAFGHDAQVAGDAKLQFAFPAASATHHAYIWFQPDGTENMTLRLTLSDASVAPVVITVPSQAVETRRLYTITYNSGGSGTLTASLETGSGLSSQSYFLFDSTAYKAS